MKLYQYDDLKKANQALGSFKRNGISVVEVSHAVIENKVVFFVLSDSLDKPDEPKKKENVKKEKKGKEKEGKDTAGGVASGEGKAPVDAKAGDKPKEATK